MFCAFIVARPCSLLVCLLTTARTTVVAATEIFQQGTSAKVVQLLFLFAVSLPLWLGVGSYRHSLVRSAALTLLCRSGGALG